MKTVPHKKSDDEDSVTEIKKQNESPIIKKESNISTETDGSEQKDNDDENVVLPKENGYLTVLKNVPFLLVMLGNLPAVMGLYIPYMFLPGVRVSCLRILDQYFYSCRSHNKEE